MKTTADSNHLPFQGVGDNFYSNIEPNLDASANNFKSVLVPKLDPSFKPNDSQQKVGPFDLTQTLLHSENMRDIEDYTNSKSKSRISGVSDNSVEQEVFWTSLHVMERQTLEGIASPTTTNGRPT